VVVPPELDGSAAVRELLLGIAGLLGSEPPVVRSADSGVFLEVTDSARGSSGTEGSFRIQAGEYPNGNRVTISAADAPGFVYGSFSFLRQLQTGRPIRNLDISDTPACRLRMINHWDNADGSIERGYSGKSIFFRNGSLIEAPVRLTDYARLLASIGINAISLNNVNVFPTEARLVIPPLLDDVAKVARIYSAYGIRIFLSVDFASPVTVGGLTTADPVDAAVKSFWEDIARGIYERIPDFGGFVVKADSEDRPGPHTYGRDHAEGANLLADAVAPYGGIVLWRAFVYNSHQDWRDRSTDRARAAYDEFTPLDGRFAENVALQIKNGPMDFQVREPVSPLIGSMRETGQVVELQITQEYTGQQRHLCFLAPQWKEVLDFEIQGSDSGPTVASLVRGEMYEARPSGLAAVSNIGDDPNWTGHHLAQANLYAYGRFTWSPDLSVAEIADEWVRMTFGWAPEVAENVSAMLLSSWQTYEKYTAPLGVGWMVTPQSHYGPSVDGYEYSRWGTYHFADRDGVGADRTTEHGSGFAGQYADPNSKRFESVDTCPEELILFFHHLPYTHVLPSGKTVIQHIYDSHFEGVAEVERFRERWMGLQSMVDSRRHSEVLARLDEQLQSAREWRDVINTYFLRKSGIADERGREIYP